MSEQAGTEMKAGKATTREWIGLAVIALPCLLYSMDLTVLNLAVPHLTADLKPSSSQMLWIVDIYGFLAAGSLITMGTLGDRIGRRRLLLIGSAVFGLASIAAAFATTAPMLIATRAVLGVAAATLAPSTLSLISNMFPNPRERTIAIGVWISSYSVGGVIGPLIGGVILAYFWWGAVFLVAVPVMVLLLIVGPVLLPEFRNPTAGRLDFVSMAQSLAAVLAVIYGLKRWAEAGFDWLWAVFILAGIAIGAIFVRRQRRLTEPLIDLSLFRSPGFSAALATGGFSFFMAFGSFFLTAQYLQFVLGLTPLEAGLCTAPSGVAFIAGSMVTAPLTTRYGPSAVMTAGLLVAAIGYGLLTQLGTQGGVALLITAFIVYSLGFAPVFTLATDMIVSAAPVERSGAAAAISETNSEFAGAVGIAILGSVATAIYRGGIMAHLPPSISSEQAVTAGGTVGGAVDVAAQLPAAAGDALLQTARAAYVDGFQMMAGIGVILLLISAGLAATLLRGIRPEPA